MHQSHKFTITCCSFRSTAPILIPTNQDSKKEEEEEEDEDFKDFGSCVRTTALCCSVMAPEWEMAMAVDAGAGMAAYYSTSSRSVPPTNTAPVYGAFVPPAAADVSYFSSKKSFSSAASGTKLYSETPTDPPTSVVAGSSSFYSVLQSQQQSSLDLYVPQCEDAAELEWLSQFMEDSFSDALTDSGWSSISPPAACVAQVHADPPAATRGARSKRPKVTAWQPQPLNSPSSSTSSSYELSPSEPSSSAGAWRNGRGKKGGAAEDGPARRCTHCASEKTPQWRTGPLGPKTLCNACGVRYKSGRLVQEYRPAASPTFVLTQHSNSHRKVMELRRQKELLHRQQSDPSSGALSELL
ncbi:GATA transcription factor 4-like [Zingiber officinale]|uniref:GATA-type domain-containing protein n=1 Tax=Zingiber officinale TaxID=94328 RepID=A0A8J5IEB5_ZINOF|nr:GATA transcription factor 4-like [Zingiber officinale]KAG6533431.1 hypothetical protein ZIOFF_007299 [Zingiber officinale]